MGILKQDNECEDEEIKEEINQREPLTKTRFLPSLEGKYWDDENEENSLHRFSSHDGFRRSCLRRR